MKYKIKLFFYRLNFKRTWVFIALMFLLSFFVYSVFVTLDYAFIHFDEIKSLVEPLDFSFYGIEFTSWHVCLFLIGFIVLYIICELIKCFYCLLFECIRKRMRTDVCE